MCNGRIHKISLSLQLDINYKITCSATGIEIGARSLFGTAILFTCMIESDCLTLSFFSPFPRFILLFLYFSLFCLPSLIGWIPPFGCSSFVPPIIPSSSPRAS